LEALFNNVEGEYNLVLTNLIYLNKVASSTTCLINVL